MHDAKNSHVLVYNLIVLHLCRYSEYRYSDYFCCMITCGLSTMAIFSATIVLVATLTGNLPIAAIIAHLAIYDYHACI